MRTIFIFSLLFLTTLACAQMAQQAQMAAQLPAKIDVITLSTQHTLGQPVSVQIQLLNGSGQPVAAREPVNTELTVKQPSGQTVVTKVTLAPGESSKQVDLSIPESGVAELKIRQSEGKLIGATNYALVNRATKNASGHPAKKAGHKAVEKKSNTPQSAKPISRDLGAPWHRTGHPRLLYAAFMLQDTPSSSTPDPVLMLKVSGEDAGGGVRADGKTCARVQVFYTGADDLARDVQVWLKWSNGDFDNPVVLHKQTRVGIGCWKSKYPISAATIQIGATNPRIPFPADDKQPMKFSENIQGLDFSNPPTSITVVDNYNLNAMFYDPNGHAVKLVEPRDLLFDSNNGVIHVNPQHATVAVGKFDSSTILIPTYFGKSNIQVSADGFSSPSHEVRVTWLAALLGSLLGGLLGGWLAYVNSGGKLAARIITGLIVGFFVSWAYVLVGLPKVESSIVHNQLSVVFVALAAGFVGVKAISVVIGKLNLGF